MDIKIITKQVEVISEVNKYSDDEFRIFLGTEQVKEIVEKKFVLIPQPDIEMEYDVYMGQLQSEKEQSEKAILEAQEKISESESKIESIELLDNK